MNRKEREKLVILIMIYGWLIVFNALALVSYIFGSPVVIGLVGISAVPLMAHILVLIIGIADKWIAEGEG